MNPLSSPAIRAPAPPGAAGRTRRGVLRSLFAGSLVMPGVLSRLLAEQDGLAPQPPPRRPRAERILWIYLTGGFSHLDTFDPKPRLAELARAEGADTRILPSPWAFRRGGRAGIEISDLFPHLRNQADRLCLVRSLHTDHGNHAQATLGIHTGSFAEARPSIGSWVSYGLGTLNRNLPSFVVLAPRLPYNGALAWGSAFLPGEHQGTRILPSDDPVPNLRRLSASSRLQQLERDLLRDANRRHLASHPHDPALRARIQAMETAFGMQQAMPEVLDLSRESDATHALYGLERGRTDGFAWQCLVARRLAESGVRFIELIDTGADRNWDAHTRIESHAALARNVDQPIAGLLADLEARGLLDSTLVVCTTEFGRTHTLDGAGGRGHHKGVFSSWLAGGGTRAGTVVGSSDALGRLPVDNPVHVHDFHATILHLLGLDHETLTHLHGGRHHRLTDLGGRVVPEIVG